MKAALCIVDQNLPAEGLGGEKTVIRTYKKFVGIPLNDKTTAVFALESDKKLAVVLEEHRFLAVAVTEIPDDFAEIAAELKVIEPLRKELHDAMDDWKEFPGHAHETSRKLSELALGRGRLQCVIQQIMDSWSRYAPGYA